MNSIFYFNGIPCWLKRPWIYSYEAEPDLFVGTDFQSIADNQSFDCINKHPLHSPQLLIIVLYCMLMSCAFFGQTKKLLIWHIWHSKKSYVYKDTYYHNRIWLEFWTNLLLTSKCINFKQVQLYHIIIGRCIQKWILTCF